MSRTYIMTPADLKANSSGLVGLLTEMSYADAISKARELAAKAGIEKPSLIVGIHFKRGAHPMGIMEIAYPITEKEWAIFQSDSKVMCPSSPEVHMVDGRRFMAPI